MVSASGSGRGRGQVEVPQVVLEVLDSWSSYCVLNADYESMEQERRRLLDRANDPSCPAPERMDIQQAQLPALLEEMNANLRRRKDIAAVMREKIDDAVEAARGLGGSASRDALEQLSQVKDELARMAAEEEDARRAAEALQSLVPSVQPVPRRTGAAPAQEMVEVGGETMTREEYERQQRRIQEALSLEGIQAAVAAGQPLAAAPATAAAPALSPEYSASYRTVMRWYRELLALEEDNGRRVARLERDEREGNTRSANIQRKKIDENVEEMVQLMANISRSLSDAMAESGESRRQRESLDKILATWNERQQKLLDAMAARGEPPEALAATYGAARYLCTNSMDDVLFMFTGQQFVAYGREGTVAPPAPTETALPRPMPIPAETAVVPVQQVAAGGPVQVPEGEKYFEWLNARTGRRYRISIDGMDLSGMGIDEVYALVQEYASSASKFRKLHVSRVDERGREIYHYESRFHVRDRFFQEQLGWAPGAVAIAAPPAAAEAERPPVAAPSEARPAAEIVAVPVALVPEYSTDYSTVMGWNRRLARLEEENKELMRRATASRDTSAEREIERKFDANVEEQVQLMANISRSLADAIEASRGANRRRLEAIMDGWPGVQARLLDLVDVRGSLRTPYPTYPEPLRTSIEYLCTNPIDVIRSDMLRAAPAAEEAPAPVERLAPAAPAPAVPAVAQAAPAPVEAAPAAPAEIAAPAMTGEARAAREEAVRRVLDNIAGMDAVSLATRYRLVDTGQSALLQRFMSGESPVLSVRVTTPEAAGELLRYVSLAAELRGVPADFGIAEPAEGRNYYTVYYRRVGAAEQAVREAVANQNPMGLINLDSTLPVDTSPYNGFVDDFNTRHPDMQISFRGFAQNSDELAAAPESQAIAYAAQTASTLAAWRFNLGTGPTNGFNFMAEAMYGRRGENAYEIEMADTGPRLSLEETAMFAAGFFTANTGRAMVTMQGQENVEGIDVNIFPANIRAAADGTTTTAYMEHGEAERRGISTVDYKKYAGSAYYRMQSVLQDPALYADMLASLPPEQRAGLEAGAELLGRFMYEMRRSRLGEPDDPAATLAACVESARMIIVAKGYAEAGDLAFTFFTYGERQFMVGTNSLVTHDFARWKPAGGWQFQDPEFQRTHGNLGFYNMLFVPTETPGRVLIVGVIGDNNELQMLSQPVEYQLDWRDSVGLAGFTRRWCHNLPLINVGAFPSVYYEEGLQAPFVGLPSEYPDVSPPGLLEARTRLGYAVPLLGGEAEHYTTGEVLDEAEFTISNPTLYYPDRTVAGQISLDQMLENPYTEVEWAMFRVPRRDQNVFYATLNAQAAERYADIFQGEIVHTAEFRDNVVYMYVDTTTGKIVDALDPNLRGAEGHRVDRFAVGTYSFTFERDELRSQAINIQPGAEAQAAGIPADARNFVLARLTGRELLEMRESQAGVVTASGENTVTVSFQPAGNVRSAIASDPELYPPDESYLALASVRAPMPVRAGTTVAAGAYDYSAFEASVRRLAEIRTEYMALATEAKTFESGEEERNTEIRMANLLMERRRVYDSMLESVEAALPSYTGDARAELERFRDSILETRGWSEEELTNFINSLSSDTFYSRAYVQARADELVSIQAEFMRVRDEYYASTDPAQSGQLVDQGWTLVLRRREIYEDILRRIDSALVFEPGDAERLNSFRAQVQAGMEAYYPSTEVDYDALRAEYGR